jgi:acyl-CoA synthetase (AMP-forming)/AMP-acid ligase II
VARVAALAGPRVLVAEAPVEGVQAALVTADELLHAPPDAPPARAGIDLDLATLCWTSGSTGEPKGVMLTHAHLRQSAAAIGAYLEHTADDVVLCVLPLSHTYGLFQLLVTHAFGGTLVLERTFTLATPLLERLAELRVTGFAGVPTIYASILALRHPEAFELGSLRYLTNAAYALPAAHVRRLGEVFPRARLFAMYGQTECTRVSYLPPELAASHPGSVGLAMPNEEAYLVDAGGAPVPPGQVGELVIRGANVMRGYWRDAEATARALRPGRYPGEVVLHTGDLFRLDDDGLLHFVSRLDDVIKTRGEKVAPGAVEEVIGALPGVLDCAVVGVPDPRHGMVVKAAVVVRPGHHVDADEIKRAVRAELDDAAVPRLVEFLAELPRGETGKLLRGALR